MPTTYQAPTSNFLSTTLNGTINDSVDTITLNSTTGLQYPGVVVIDREDGNGTATPNAREVVAYTGISGSDLTGCTRGAENSTARSHSSGALVEPVFSVGQWNDLIDSYQVEHNDAGTHKAAVVTTLKATSAEVTTGTSDTTIVTPKALKDAGIVALSKASAAEVNTGSDDAKYATPSAIRTAKQTVTSYTPSGAGTTTITLNTGNVHIVTMPADTQTLAVSGGATGQCFILSINNVTSQGALTWFSTIKWAGGSAPTLTGTNGKRDTFGFVVTGTDTYDGFVVGQNI